MANVRPPNIVVCVINQLVVRPSPPQSTGRPQSATPYNVISGIHMIVMVIVARQKRRRIDRQGRRHHLAVIKDAVIEHDKKWFGRAVLVRRQSCKEAISTRRRRRRLAERISN